MHTPNKDEPYSGLLKIFDRPLTRDWVFWLFAIVAVASGASGLRGLGSGEQINPIAGLIDGAINVGINYVIFGVIPSSIRARVRRRRVARNDHLKESVTERQPLPSPTTLSETQARIEESVKAPSRSKTTRRVALVASGILLTLFAQGNWEYRKLLSDIENGESILVNYNSKTGILSDVFKSVQTPLSDYDRERVNIAIQKWESLARESNEELAIWQEKISSSFQAPWNEQTSRNRQEILIHYDAWSENLYAKSVDLFHSGGEQYTKRISESFLLFCIDAKRSQSLFAWPSSFIDGKDRVEEICKS